MSAVPLLLIATRKQAALAALLLGLICALVAGVTGFVVGKRLGVAHSERVLAEYRAAVIDQVAVDNAQHEAQKDTLIERGMQLGSQLVAEREQHALQAAHLKRSIARVTQPHRPAPSAEAELVNPADTCRLTVGFVGVYNAAIGAEEPANLPDPAGTGGADPQADPAEAADAGVRPEDILYHLADYGQRCRDMESQLVRLIELREPADGRD